MKRFIFAVVALFVLTSLAPAAGCAFAAVRVKNVVQVQRVVQVQKVVAVRQVVAVQKVEVAAIAVPFVQVASYSTPYAAPYYAPPQDNSRLERAIERLTEVTLQNQALLQQNLKQKP